METFYYLVAVDDDYRCIIDTFATHEGAAMRRYRESTTYPDAIYVIYQNDNIDFAIINCNYDFILGRLSKK